MNSIRNSVQLVGHLGKDVELKTLEGGNSVANLTMATNDYYKNKEGEYVQQTEWHRVSAWGKLGEAMSIKLKKGSHVIVKGKLTSRSYENKEGITQYITEVQANDFVLLDKKEMPF